MPPEQTASGYLQIKTQSLSGRYVLANTGCLTEVVQQQFYVTVQRSACLCFPVSGLDCNIHANSNYLRVS